MKYLVNWRSYLIHFFIIKTLLLFVVEIQYINMFIHSRYLNNHIHRSCIKSLSRLSSKSSKQINNKNISTKKVDKESIEYTLDITMDQVQKSILKSQNDIITGLKGNGWIVIDNFLDLDLCNIMRKEAVHLYENNYFTISQSTRWDTKTQTAIAYDKHNVFSTQLQGGEQYYIAPRLHEYMVGMTKTIEPILSQYFPEAQLSNTLMSNKLAVCTGNGSAYDKHYDNSGMEDTRKVTILYYMNNQWRSECGGCFRIYKSSSPSSTINSNSSTSNSGSNSNNNDGEEKQEDINIDIEPLANRLLMFWYIDM